MHLLRTKIPPTTIMSSTISICMLLFAILIILVFNVLDKLCTISLYVVCVTLRKNYKSTLAS